MEQTAVKTNGAGNGKAISPEGDGQKIIGKIECRRDGAAQDALQHVRRWGYPSDGYFENALGKELAWTLKGNRYRILKAFAAAIEHSLSSPKREDNRGA